jgi:O-antigen/teichoic acid export membrane protein
MIQKLKSLKNHQGFMKYFKNTSWLFLEKVLKIASELFIGIWIARYLGPEHFGLLSYSQSFAGLFMVIATLGLNTIIVRELVKGERKRDLLLGTSFILQLAGAFFVLLLILVSISFSSNDSFTNTLIFIIALSMIFKSFNVIDFYFQSKVLSKYTVYANMILLSLSSIIKILLILNEASLIYFAYILLFESFILAIGFIYFYTKNNISIFNWKFDKTLALGLLKDSWPLILSGIVITVYMKIDQVMIQEMMGSKSVGQYAAAVRLSEAWYFIPMIIASSLFPAIINAKKINDKLYHTRLQKLYDLMVWMGIAIAIPMTFMSDWLVELLYGVQYSLASDVLMLHIWAGVFVFLGVSFSKYLTAENQTKKAFYRTLLGAVINVLLNYILIPIYGINGAAIATIIGQISANYLYDIFDKDLHGQLKMKTMCFFPVHILKGYR